MKYNLTLFILLCATTLTFGQRLYIKTFGKENSNPIIFLHGGPGYNCANFEATTAQELADNGYFVIVYDRRGEGRSLDANAKYTFVESIKDINEIYESYNLNKATLLGHSFGGMLAIKYAEQYPNKIQSIILAGAPINLQESFKHIIAKSKKIYEEKKDSINLNYIKLLTQLDTVKLEYSTYCFGHAMQNGFYSPKNPTIESKEIYKKAFLDTTFKKHASKMTYDGPRGFWTNEKYTTLDLTLSIKKLISQQISIYGIYGKEDGLYSEKQIQDLKQLVGMNNIKYLENCSHNVFIDQQKIFIESIQNWIR